MVSSLSPSFVAHEGCVRQVVETCAADDAYVARRFDPDRLGGDVRVLGAEPGRIGV